MHFINKNVLVDDFAVVPIWILIVSSNLDFLLNVVLNKCIIFKSLACFFLTLSVGYLKSPIIC